jgi:hypothetical protein
MCVVIGTRDGISLTTELKLHTMKIKGQIGPFWILHKTMESQSYLFISRPTISRIEAINPCTLTRRLLFLFRPVSIRQVLRSCCPEVPLLGLGSFARHFTSTHSRPAPEVAYRASPPLTLSPDMAWTREYQSHGRPQATSQHSFENVITHLLITLLR